MNWPLSRKQQILAIALGSALLIGGTAALLPGSDDMEARIRAYGLDTSELTRGLQAQMEAIRQGQSVNVADGKGFTPLMNAAHANAVADVDYLLIKGARIKRKAPNGKSALDMAENPRIKALLSACNVAESAPSEAQKEEMRQHLRKSFINPDDLTQGMFDAVEKWYGDEKIRNIARVLALGGNANAINSDGRHILECRHIDSQALVMLLRYGADPNARLNNEGGSVVLSNNIARNKRNTRNLFLCNASAKGATILSKAAGKGDAETVRMLLEHGADPNGTCNGKSILEHAVQGLSNPHGDDATVGIPATVRLLLSAGARTETTDKEGKPRSPISPGGMSILPACIRALVDAGADVNALNSRGANYAHIAVYKEGTRENLKLLEDIIDAGADLKHVDNKGETFLFYALPTLCNINVQDKDEEKREEAEDLLEDYLDIIKDAEPDPAALDRNGNTALHLAVIRRGPADDRLVEFLLKMGVDPTVRNKFGRTALEAMLRSPYGRRSKHVARLLTAHGPMPQQPAQQLVLASMMDDTQAIRKLLESRHEPDVLSRALGCVQNAAAADLLIKAGAPLYYEDAENLLRYGNPDVIRIFAGHKKQSCLSRRWDCVQTKAMAKAFIDAGIPFPQPHEIANDEVLAYLLTLPSFNVNAKELTMQYTAHNNAELLLPNLASQGRRKMTAILLKHGVALDGYPASPLELTEDEEIARMLIDHGTNLNSRTSTGETLLSARKSKLAELAKEYRENPTLELLERFASNYRIAEMLDDAGVADAHPRRDEIKRALQRPDCAEDYETVQFETDGWHGSIRISREAMVLARSSGNTDTANILSIDEDSIRFKWDRWGFGYVVRKHGQTYKQAVDDTMYLDFRKNPTKVPHYYATFVNEQGADEKLYIHPNFEYAMRAGKSEFGRITRLVRHYRAGLIALKWDKGGTSNLVVIDDKLHVMGPATVKKKLQDYRPDVAFKELRLVGNSWADVFRYSEEYQVGARATRARDTATVLRYTDRHLTLKWDRWDTESFTKRDDGKYYSDKLPTPESKNIRQLMREGSATVRFRKFTFVHPGWTCEVRVSFKQKEAVQMGGKKAEGRITRFNKNSITIKWDQFGEETFERHADGRFHLKH